MSDRYGLTSMTNLCVKLPTRSVAVETTFSNPNSNVARSRFLDSRSMTAVTTTSACPGVSGVPLRTPVAGSSLSHCGPYEIAYLGLSTSQ
jgi:hypothetical protein